MCGIFGFSSKNSKSITNILEYLKKLQHRGNDGYGYITDTEYVRTLGKIDNIHSKNKTKQLIAHTRYTTSGSHSAINQLHPIQKNSMFIVHNGNIPNIDIHDTKYLLSLCDENNILNSLIYIVNNISAAYSFLLYVDDTIYMVRDKNGIRPLCYSQVDNDIYIASESCALPSPSIDVPAGTIHKITNGKIDLLYYQYDSRERICAFEIFYFMNPTSYYNNIQIADIRKELGKKLAEKDDFDNSYQVVGVPKSGIMAAQGYANKLAIPLSNAITLVNEDRSFITTQEQRKLVCHKKFNFDTLKIKDKKLIIIDDTIVRGTVLKEIVNQLRKIGAKEIHIRIPAPPIIDTCIYGISIRTKEELLINNYSIDDIIKLYDINSLRYLSYDELLQVNSLFKDAYMKPFGIPF